MDWRVKPTVPFIPKPELEAAAEALLEQYQRERGKIIAPPVPIEFIAHLLGFDLIWDDFQESDTLAFIDPNEKTICFNLLKSDYFDRIGSEYTTAHELGHYRLNHFETVDSRVAQNAPSKLLHREDHEKQYKSHEFQAEYFAACLVMPRWLILKEAREYNLHHWRGIEALANRFKVSKQAMKIRLIELGLVRK